MSDATALEVMAALATQLEAQLSAMVPGIQIDRLMIRNPTPPCVDVYPGDPFDEQLTFDNGENGAGHEQLFTIRARVQAADNEASQELLLGLMDRGAGSVRAAILADTTLAGTVDEAVVEGPSGYTEYVESGGPGRWLGCEWRLRAIL